MPKTCIRCNITKNETDFSFRKDTKKYHNTCKACKCDLTRSWAKNNPDHIKARCREYYLQNMEIIKEKARNWRKKNIERVRLKDKIKQKNTCPVILRYYSRKYRQKNKHKVNSNSSFYRKKKRQSKLNYVYKAEINEFYKNCPEGMQVDHIIPVTNKLVSGLHVPWNFQYLTRKENQLKCNKFDLTHSNESWRNQCPGR